MSAQPEAASLEQEIRTEQVRLVFHGIKTSFFLAAILALLLTLVSHTEENHVLLLSWLAAVLLNRVACVGYAHQALKSGVTADNLARHITAMCVLKALEGLAWGSLTWIMMGQASLALQLLTMASLAGISGNAVSLLAPVFPFYLSMQLAQLATINSRLLTIDDSSFGILAIGCILFVIGQAGQALLAQQASRRSLMLRFENHELIKRLQVETERAEQARQKAEEANLAKSRFLAAASHDLRQPVHAQELFLEVLARTELTELQDKVLNNARAASQASAQMLNTLLDFSRIEAGVIEPQPRAFRLQPLLNKLENELGSLVDAKDIVYRSRETRLIVHSDPALLELILRNLITNAIRYTHHGGLLVGCRKRGTNVMIEIFDTGVGIDPSQHTEIFREFRQLGNPERDRLKGLGLGLAICEGLARSLGHPLTLSSKPGRGSVFRIQVPMASGAFVDTVFASVEGPPPPTRKLYGLRVLVIDDDAIVRQGMQQLLEYWGCECHAVESIAEALEQVNGWPAQLLISDYRLREHQTGGQAVNAIRAKLGWPVPALIITGDTAPERLQEARRSGVPLLHKPVSPALLQQAIFESTDTTKPLQAETQTHA